VARMVKVQRYCHRLKRRCTEAHRFKQIALLKGDSGPGDAICSDGGKGLWAWERGS